MSRNWIGSLIIVIAIAVGSYAIYVVVQPEAVPEGFLYGNGHIEGTEVLIDSETEGRIQEFPVQEGDKVAKGQTIAVIDPEVSRDRLRALRAELEALETSRDSLNSQMELWEHHAAVAERQVERIKTLMETQSASQFDLDQAENGLREARAQLRTLKSQADSLESQIDGARAKVDIAASQLNKTTITAPVAGTLLVRSAEPGEVVGPGEPIGMLVNLDRLELKIYIPGRDLGKVKLGNPAKIRIDAFPERYYQGEVTRIDDYAQFTPRDIHLPEERIRMVYGVELTLDNPDRQLKPGMPADAWIRWDDTAEWPDALPVPGT